MLIASCHCGAIRLEIARKPRLISNVLAMPLLVLALLLSAACAATPRIRQERPIGTDLSLYNTVQVIVDATERIRKQSGYDPTAAALMKEFAANIKASGKYSIVNAEPATGKVLEVYLDITELNYVHGAARSLVGILAGRAILNVTMTLKDRETGDVFGVVSAGHSSSHTQGGFSPMTSRQVSAIAKELSSRL
jgi:hypothetical protein